MWARLRNTLTRLGRRQQMERDLEEELAFHRDMLARDARADGLGPSAANTAARRRLGNMTVAREDAREAWTFRTVSKSLDGLLRDLRFGLRLFRRHPAPVSIAIGGLAVAIGVVTAAFSIVNASILRPYGMSDPASVVRVARAGEPGWAGWPYSQFLRMRDVTTLDGVEASLSRRTRISAARADDSRTERPILFVSGGYMRLLGARAFLGRTLTPSDDQPGASPVVVVSHYVWRTEFGGDTSVIGSSVRVNDTPVTLVGVLESSFSGPVRDPQAAWMPLSAVDDVRMGPPFTPAARGSVEVIARMPPGATTAAAEDSLTAMMVQTGESGTTAGGDPAARAVRVRRASSPLDEQTDTDTYVGLLCVAGITGLVLVLACANTANLLMASAVTRIREVGVRLAMGATRGRLVVQMLRESLLLGLAAGAAGFLLAFWLVPVLGRMVAMPADSSVAPDWRVLLFTVTVAIVCGLGAGITPARYGAGDSVLAALRSETGSRGTPTRPSRFRAWLVGSQAAMSMLLLVCGALLLRTAERVSHVDLGFDAGHLLAVSLEPLRPRLDRQSLLRTALASVHSVPSVESATVTEYEPFGHSRAIDRFTFGGVSYEVRSNYADAEFFTTTRLRIARGRGFTADEVTREAPVALISENVARTFFAGGEAIGQSLSQVPALGGQQQAPAIVVGVVADAVLDGPESEIHGAIYRPLRLKPQESFTDQGFAVPLPMLVRTATPGPTAAAIEATLRRVTPEVRPTIRVIGDGVNTYLDGRRRLAWLLGPPALLALALATLGVYGVTMFVVSQRTAEVAVRMALGASSIQVLRLLMKDGLRPVLVGLPVGLGLALLLSRVAARELAGISPHDPLSISMAFSALMACAVVAVVVPAWRATRTDPARSLREC